MTAISIVTIDKDEHGCVQLTIKDSQNNWVCCLNVQNTEHGATLYIPLHGVKVEINSLDNFKIEE